MKKASRNPKALLIFSAALCVLGFGWTESAESQSWMQWAQNPQHQGFVTVAGQSLDGQLADIVYDPLVPDEQAANGGELLAHYQAPLIAGDDVFMEFKDGDYSNPFNSQHWHQVRLHWQAGQLVEKWRFNSDWKPEPIDYVGGWEPVYHAVLANGYVYDPGFGGTILKLTRGNGQVVTRINPFGSTLDPNTFTAGPLSADDSGNIYYNVIKLDPTQISPFTGAATTVGSWLVKVQPDDSTSMVSFSTLIPNAPATCIGRFSNSQLPWPPSPTAQPTTMFPCGIARAGVNVAPAIAPDGTIYTVGKVDNSPRYGWMVAVNPNLTLKWHTSMRNLFNDGCGVLIPIASGATPEKGKCRFGAVVGVNPETNRPGDGNVIDQSSSSPTVTPDGNVLYGSYSRYNIARGHVIKFNGTTGAVMAFFDFGWDSTPAIFPHDGTYSVVIKDNHYDEEAGFYCNPSGGVSDIVCASTGIPAGPFFITQLSPSLIAEWKFKSTETHSCTRQPDGSLSCVADHPNGFEWCINAPAIDVNGVVYAESEDGNAYSIGQGGIFKQRLFLNLALGAAYTPLSIGHDGKLYTQNDGHLFVVGTGGQGVGHGGGHSGLSTKIPRIPDRDASD